jgi:hypothetical protein
MATAVQIENLVKLYEVLAPLPEPENFNPGKWNTCLGHLAAKHGVGGLWMNSDGWPCYKNLNMDFAIREIFGSDALHDVFVNNKFYTYSYSQMIEMLYYYLVDIHNYAKPVIKKSFDYMLNGTSVAKLFQKMKELEAAGTSISSIKIVNGEVFLQVVASTKL